MSAKVHFLLSLLIAAAVVLDNKEHNSGTEEPVELILIHSVMA